LLIAATVANRAPCCQRSTLPRMHLPTKCYPKTIPDMAVPVACCRRY